MEGSENATYGQAAIDRFIQDCLVPRSAERDRPLPIVIVLGPPGSGKTALLNAEQKRLEKARTVPYARLNLAEFPLREIIPVLDRLVRQLARRWGGFGRLRFPRYRIGRIALAAAAQQPTREAVLNALRSSAGLLDVQALADPGIHVLQGALGLSAWVRGFAKIVAWAVSTERVLRLRYRRSLSWYGAWFEQTPQSGLDALVDFALSAHAAANADEPDDLVERTLCAAFLADLKATFRRGATDRVGNRSVNCALLLDNAHAPAGVRLLRAISHARTTTADTALVVATTQRWLEPLNQHWTWLAAPGAGNRVRSPESAGYADWCEVSKERSEDWTQQWYPIALRDLRLGEVKALVGSQLGLRFEHLASFVHRLTAGYPHAVAQVVRVIRAGIASGADIDEAFLRTIMDRSPSSHAVLTALLPGLPEPDLQALVTCSAAPYVDADFAVSARLDRLEAARDEILDRLWLVSPEPPDLPRSARAPSAIHPWLRRLLLAELGRRQHPGWDDVHSTLRSTAPARQPLATRRLYHALASEQLAEVVRELLDAVRRQPPVDTKTWVAAVREITSAPARPPTDESPGDRLNRLVADAVHAAGQSVSKEGEIVTNLVVALWIHHDPLLDPWQKLGSVAASSLRSVFGVLPLDTVYLHEVARHYEEKDSLP